MFNQPSVLNLMRMARDQSWQESPALLAMVRSWFLSLGQTRVVEDANHFVFDLETRQQTNNVTSGIRLWREIVNKQVLGTVHGYPEAMHGCLPGLIARRRGKGS